MDREIKVSAVIAAYNSEEYIRQCINSLLAQTMKEIEIIVVNDGSQDSTWEILKEYADKDGRVRIFTQENQGAGAARNVGMSHARGKYMMVLDADDYFDAEMLESLYRQAEEKHAEIVICSAYGIDVESGNMRKMYNLISGHAEKGESVFAGKDAASNLFQMSHSVAWNKFYRREFVEKHRLEFQNIRVIDDLYFALMSMALAERICFCDRALVYYRENNADSQIMNLSKYPENPYLAFRELKDGLHREEIYETFKETYLNLVMSEVIMMQLNSMDNMETFKKVYDLMRNGGFAELGIDEGMLPLVRSADIQMEYQRIMKFSAEEYIFQKSRQIHEAMGDFYLLPRTRELQGNRIVIYGAGVVGKSYYAQCMCSGFCKAVLWVDRDYERLKAEGLPIQSPEKITETEFDYIVIAQFREPTADRIKKDLLKMGIPEAKIRYYHPVWM